MAPRCLSEDVRNRNIRKVETNATVTFVIWVLEFFANACIVIVWLFVYGKTNFGTLTINMIWYYLILPHTFLMNTSHNKDLIVDNGWKTTLRNALSLPISFRRHNLDPNNEQNEGLGISGKENTIKIAVISNSKEICRDEEASEQCNVSTKLNLTAGFMKA